MQYDPLFILTIGTHFFTVTKANQRTIGIILNYCQRFITYGFVRSNNKMVRKASKVFAIRSKDGMEYRFHIGQLPGLLEYLNKNYITEDLYTTVILPEYESVSIKTKVQDKFTLRDYQLDCKAFVLSNDFNDNHSRLVSLPTGSGKSLLACAAIADIGKRVAIVILPQYMEKWAGDIQNNLVVNPKRIMLIQGSDSLRGVISVAKDNLLDVDFIIISLTTIQNFFKAYEEDRHSIEDTYGCRPDELYEILKVGVITIDETHQHIHSVYRTLAYTHGPKVIGLSGTLISDDPTVAKMHKLIFPKEIRYDKVSMGKYIKVRAIAYQFRNFRQSRVRTTSYGTNVYSHVEFEKTLMKNKDCLHNYMLLIDSMVKQGFLEDYQPGDKLIIFATTIKMCDRILQYLKTHYNKRFDIRRYVEDDPYENAIDADIRVTTIQSCGTAVDIPKLRTAILTTSIQSPVSNLQALGRLRDLKDRDVKFYYCYSEDIPKHVEYHQKKMELFEDKSASIKELKSNIMI